MILASGCSSERAARVYPYTSPLSSPGGKFGELPLAVQRSVHAEAGKAELHDVRKFTRADRVIYEIIFQDPDSFPPLYISSDGSVLFPDFSVAVSAAEET